PLLYERSRSAANGASTQDGGNRRAYPEACRSAIGPPALPPRYLEQSRLSQVPRLPRLTGFAFTRNCARIFPRGRTDYPLRTDPRFGGRLRKRRKHGHARNKKRQKSSLGG